MRIFLLEPSCLWRMSFALEGRSFLFGPFCFSFIWGLSGKSHVLRSLGELQEAVGRTNARLEFENFGQYILRTISRTGCICAEQVVN